MFPLLFHTHLRISCMKLFAKVFFLCSVHFYWISERSESQMCVFCFIILETVPKSRLTYYLSDIVFKLHYLCHFLHLWPNTLIFFVTFFKYCVKTHKACVKLSHSTVYKLFSSYNWSNPVNVTFECPVFAFEVTFNLSDLLYIYCVHLALHFTTYNKKTTSAQICCLSWLCLLYLTCEMC